MEIVWDERKRLANIGKRGLDFTLVTVDLLSTSLIVEARAGRSKAVGRIADRTFVVVYKRLGTEALSVISFRRASRKERVLYEQFTEGADRDRQGTGL